MPQPSMRGRRSPVQQSESRHNVIREDIHEVETMHLVKDVALRRIQCDVHQHPDKVQGKNLLNETQSILHTNECRIWSCRDRA